MKTKGASQRVLTCVYCGHEYPPGTPASGGQAQALTDHIRACETHPMREVEHRAGRLRNALAGLVGASTRADLEQMRDAMSLLPMDAETREATGHAIDVLLEADRPAEASSVREHRAEQLRLEFAAFVKAMDAVHCFDTPAQCNALIWAKRVLAAYPNIADRREF